MLLRSTFRANSRPDAWSLQGIARRQNWCPALKASPDFCARPMVRLPSNQERPVFICLQAFWFSRFFDGRRSRRISGVAATLAYPLTRRRQGTGCVETGSCTSLCFVDSMDSFVVVDIRLAIAEPVSLGQQIDKISCVDGFQSPRHGEI